MSVPIPVQPPLGPLGPVGEEDVAAGVDSTAQASFFTAWQHFANRLGKLNPDLLRQAGRAHASLDSLMKSR